MKETIVKWMKNKTVISYSIIVFVAIFICIPLFSKYMDITGDDGIQHLSRIIGTASSLKEGGIFPVIMSEFCNGFGYSWNLFYSPLTAYLPLLFQMITPSFIMCLKLFMFLTIVLSGIFMFKLVRVLSKSYTAGILAALIYMTAPYHLTDLYHRVAIAELATFIFLPMVFLGIHYLFTKKEKKIYYLAIGAIGLILSHTVMAMYTAIICGIYVVLNWKRLKDKIVQKHLVITIGIILLCVSFFIIPLLEHQSATTYEVFVEGRMYSTNTLISSKLGLLDLFVTKPYGMIFHIGLPIAIGIIFFIVYRKNIAQRYKRILTIFVAFGLVSTFMATKLFPFEYLPSVFKMIQFQWRMLEFANFFLSIVSGITIAMYLNSKRNRKNSLLEIVLMLYTVFLLLAVRTSVQIPIKEEILLEPIPVTQNTTRIHANMATFEYLPQKAYQNLEYIINRNQEAKLLSGEASILNQEKQGNKFHFEIEKVSNNTVIELPYIYYLGYEATLIDQDGIQKKLETTESNNGFVEITVPETEKAKIEVSYQGTTLMKLSYFFTTIGMICLVVYPLYYSKKKNSLLKQTKQIK